MDITIDVDDYKLNVRAAGVMIHNGKILVHRNVNSDHYALIGGRVEIGESSANTIKREIKEELGKDIEITGYISTIENFFEMKGSKYHEIMFVHKIEFTNEEDKKIEYIMKNVEGKDYLQYEWIDLDKIEEYPLLPKAMKNIEKYYNNTESEKPRKNVQYLIEKVKYNPGKAIELGCGAGNDTVYLIKNNWNVLAIDRESVEERITKRLNNEELEKFRFQKQNFESLELEKNNLIVANYCLPFCNKNNFKELWNKINNSILKDGYFVGNFFGINDEWKSTKEEMTFLTKEQVIELFKDFEIIEFKEVEKDGATGLGKMKHWHIFNVIAKKK